jgi:hypothetical protein
MAYELDLFGKTIAEIDLIQKVATRTDRTLPLAYQSIYGTPQAIALKTMRRIRIVRGSLTRTIPPR